MIGLGIDAGGSSSRWLLVDAHENVVGEGKAGPITGHVFTEESKQENLRPLRALLAAAAELARPDAVVGGVTGLHSGTGAARLLQAEVAKALALEPARVRLENDMGIAYASVFAPGEGLLIYAGTGSVGYHIGKDGRVLRAGGYGYLIDDAGAGYWIGHEGIKQVFRWLDEGGEPASRPLARAIYSALGGDDWDHIVAEVYGGGRSRVAALAPAVAQAAEMGDAAARAILERAGRELARLAQVIFERLGSSLPVRFAGGITKLSPVLTKSLRETLAPVELELSSEEPVRAAARLALELARKAA